MEKISVILPVKNGANFIARSIGSFLDQKVLGVKKELIVVDDHSSDETFCLVQEFVALHREVLLIKNEGIGIINALTSGLSVAEGDYISRMDADDVMPPDKLNSFVQALINNPSIHVATGKVQYFHWKDKKVGDGFLKYQYWLNSLVETGNFYQDIYKECVVASPNWMMRRSDLDRVGGFGDTYPEDYNLVFKWYAASYKIGGVDQVTHHWYDHAARTSRNDEVYADNNFFDLKLRWFFELDYRPGGKVIMYGAGNKGKILVKKLLQKGVEVIWCSNNPNKIGKSIYGVKLISDQEPIEKMGSQIVIAIAIKEDKHKIEKRLEVSDLIRGRDYFFFA